MINGIVEIFLFSLEEPPAYGTPYMGSRVYAEKARREKEKIDGMICLEMVGLPVMSRIASVFLSR